VVRARTGRVVAREAANTNTNTNGVGRLASSMNAPFTHLSIDGAFRTDATIAVG
jgi:hypothetical protein